MKTNRIVNKKAKLDCDKKEEKNSKARLRETEGRMRTINACSIIILEGRDKESARRQFSEAMAEKFPEQYKILGCTSGFKDSARPHLDISQNIKDKSKS